MRRASEINAFMRLVIVEQSRQTLQSSSEYFDVRPYVVKSVKAMMDS